MDGLERAIRDWAAARRDVDGLFVVGSRARGDGTEDRWSDLDLGLVAARSTRYFTGSAWLSELGECLVAYRDPAGTTWHAVFQGGLEVGIAPLASSTVRVAGTALRTLGRHPALRRLLPSLVERRLAEAEDAIAQYCGRGFRVLVDEHGHLARLSAVVAAVRPPERLPPSEADFTAAVDEFLHLALWTAKHLRRGELFRSKLIGTDGRMRVLLLRMIEWHTHTIRPGVDTWRDGQFIETWADPALRRELTDTYGGNDVASTFASLLATTDLFHRLATDTADRLSFTPPGDVARDMRDLVARIAELGPHDDMESDL